MTYVKKKFYIKGRKKKIVFLRSTTLTITTFNITTLSITTLSMDSFIDKKLIFRVSFSSQVTVAGFEPLILG